MKNLKPIVLLSFLFFTSVISNDFSQPLVDKNEIADFDDSEDFDFDNIDDFDNDENEDIIYTKMISASPPTKKTTPSIPVPPPKYVSNPSFSATNVVCKKWRCKLNGYVPIWNKDVSSACSNNYGKLSWSNKAFCQEKFCEKVCEKF